MKMHLASGAVVFLSVLLAGCLSSPPPSPRPTPPEPPPRVQLTGRDICQSLEGLLTEQLGAINFKAGPEPEFDDFYDEPVVYALCPVTSTMEDSNFGNLSIREIKGGDTLDTLEPRDIGTIVDGETAWYFDERTVNPSFPLASVKVATMVDGWFGKLEIYPRIIPTAEGFLEFNEADREVVSRYLIETVRKAAATNAN